MYLKVRVICEEIRVYLFTGWLKDMGRFTMIEKNIYESLKEKYGHVASWAVWRRTSGAAKSNMKDVSMFESEDILEVLNPNYVFVGLNGSGVHDDYMDMSRPWHNFHSSNPSGHDFKLCYALMDTPYWGSYITDAIKGLPEVDSGKVVAYLKSHPEMINKNMEILRREIEMLGDHPIIVAMGGKSYELVSKYLGKQFTVKKITHYSFTIGKENYREHVLKVLSDGDEELCIPKTPKIQEITEVLEAKVNPVKSTVNEKRGMNSGIPSLEEQLQKTGLDDPDNWRGDIKKQLLMLFEPVVRDTDFSIRINEGDTTKVGLNLFYKDTERRSMGFEKLKDRMFKVFPVKKFYEEIMYKVELPEIDANKSQIHMKMTLEQFWEFLYKITR